MGDPAHPVSVISGPHHRPGVSTIAPVSPLSVLASAGPKVLQCPSLHSPGRATCHLAAPIVSGPEIGLLRPCVEV